jgi:hypothetical protein
MARLCKVYNSLIIFLNNECNAISWYYVLTIKNDAIFLNIEHSKKCSIIKKQQKI